MGFEFVSRPYQYARTQFQLANGELVSFSGLFYSLPASGALLDKRLFSSPGSTIPSPFKLYINKDANVFLAIEPSVNASGYDRATPHYANYITDIRSVLQDVFSGHASDSDHSAGDFKRAHLERVRAPYDLPNSSRPDVGAEEYVHPNPVNIVPTGNELGAKYTFDIDVDEIQWQPFTRPKNIRKISISNIPIEPIFPAALVNGGLPTFSAFDNQKYGQLGLGIGASGGVLITGDVLIQGTTVKLVAASGAVFGTEGSFIEEIPWKLFPIEESLDLYYTNSPGDILTAHGRQARYGVPSPPIGSGEGVFILNVSDAGSSGVLVQNWPGNYSATSGIDRNGKAHDGVHVVSRLIYNINEMTPDQLNVGRSLINGKRIFGHFVGTETASNGKGIGGLLKYNNNNSIYAYAGVVNPFVSTTTSTFEWATTNNLFSPVSWSVLATTALQPRLSPFGDTGVTYDVSDINASDVNVATFKRYTQWGAADRITKPDLDRALGGNLQSTVITFETHVYREGTNPDGSFAWIELPPPESPFFTYQQLNWFENTFNCGNIFSFFFDLRPNFGILNVNGAHYIQWSERVNGVPILPRTNRFTPIGDGTTRLSPPTNRSVVGVSRGGRIFLYVTTNNQQIVPDFINISPTSQTSITFAASIPMAPSNIDTFGPVAWDDVTGENYLYFKTITNRFFFAKMNTSFVITQINEVDSTDAIISGRTAVLSI